MSNLVSIKYSICQIAKKALRIISLADFREPSSHSFKKWKILNIYDIGEMQNFLLVHSFLEGKLPKSFGNFFQKPSDVQVKPTRFRRSESL